MYVKSLFDCYKQVFTTQARLNMIRPNLIENICRRRRRPPTCTSANKKKTYLYFWPKVVISATQVSMTALISGWLIRGRVTLDLGLKHITLHVPRAAADLRELFFYFCH